MFESPEGIYDSTNQLEKSKIEITTSVNYYDKCFPLVIAAVFFFVAGDFVYVFVFEEDTVKQGNFRLSQSIYLLFVLI